MIAINGTGFINHGSTLIGGQCLGHSGNWRVLVEVLRFRIWALYKVPLGSNSIKALVFLPKLYYIYSDLPKSRVPSYIGYSDILGYKQQILLRHHVPLLAWSNPKELWEYVFLLWV